MALGPIRRVKSKRSVLQVKIKFKEDTEELKAGGSSDHKWEERIIRQKFKVCEESRMV
jgi:hypothetical protein